MGHTVFPVGTHSLGYRPPDEVPKILNSLDLLLVVNQPSDFGNYSYPAKLYEAMACQIPVVAAAVPGTAWILRDTPQFLATPLDVQSFVDVAEAALALGRARYPQLSAWDASADLLEAQISC
jgi:glycosyltransferase involved in cell wall biosynthesis